MESLKAPTPHTPFKGLEIPASLPMEETEGNKAVLERIHNMLEYFKLSRQSFLRTQRRN